MTTQRYDEGHAKVGKTVCEKNLCTGCMACTDICSKSAIRIIDSLDAYNAVIDEKRCIKCNACHNVCPNNSDNDFVYPVLWKQGYSTDAKVRHRGSSGGLAGEISKAFIEGKGTVCSCAFEDGKFLFKFADSLRGVDEFSGSKYVKSNPKGVYKQIREHLRQGEKILFIGLPCQVAAVKKYIPKSMQHKLYTVDLICHGTPSPKLLEAFLEQYGYSLEKMGNIQFRSRSTSQILHNNHGIITDGVSDRYLIAFLHSLSYTDNCYKCRYARKERVSDLTLGDSWGSELPLEIQKDGLSLLLIQTEKGKELLDLCHVHLYDVDLNKAIQANHQLHSPSQMPDGRSRFFEGIRNNKKFNRLVFRALPKPCIRQNIKEVLIQLKVL